LLNLYELWIKEKEKDSIYTYDDLMLKMHQLMLNENGRAIISSLFDYVMVDEYQDVNKLQNEILTSLVNNHRNVAVVGDDYQAIYAFRGSDVKYIENYEKDNPDTTRVTIDTNYRSSDEIVEFVNEVMHKECQFGIKKDMKGIGIKNGPVRVLHVSDEEDEYQHILGEIILNHNKGVPFDEMAVLGRTSKRFTKLELLLTQNGIPYEIRGGKKFLERDEIRDLIALITCIVRPTNKGAKLSWIRVLQELVRGVGKKTASELGEDSTIENFLILPENQHSTFSSGLVSLHSALEQIRETEKRDYKNALRQLVTWYMGTRQQLIASGTKYKIESHRTAAYEELERKWSSIDSFLGIADEYSSFVTLLDGLVLNGTAKSSSASQVCLSTIHSAKGLEWDHVYMMDVIDKVYSEIDGDECLRLFYVGMTRAKCELTLYVPEYYRIKGFYTEVSMSPFISKTVKAGGYYVEEKNISRYDILHHQKLEFEMIPDTLYFKNARSALSESKWQTVSKNVRHIGICACCMKQIPSQFLEAHEVWEYDDKKHIQTLIDIIPVCEMCHDVKHIGYNIKSGHYTETELLNHYSLVNNISLEQARVCLKQARVKLGKRNEYNWTQDESSIINVSKRYLNTGHNEQQELKELHWLHYLPYDKKDEYKEWCTDHGIKYKFDGIEKRWGYFGPINHDLERIWNS